MQVEPAAVQKDDVKFWNKECIDRHETARRIDCCFVNVVLCVSESLQWEWSRGALCGWRDAETQEL